MPVAYAATQLPLSQVEERVRLLQQVAGTLRVMTALGSVFTTRCGPSCAARWVVTSTPQATKDDFYAYVKSKKAYTKISDLGAIDHDGIYVWDTSSGGGGGGGGSGGSGSDGFGGFGSSDLTLSSVPPAFDSYNVVLIVDGTVSIQALVFAPTKSVAILAQSIVFSGGPAKRVASL